MAVSQFCSSAGNQFTFVRKHKAHRGAVWEGSKFKEKTSGSSWKFSSGLTGVSEFCAWRLASSAVRAGNWFTFVRKHKAHRGAVWEGSRRTSPVSEFCAWRLASSAVGRVISSRWRENTKRNGVRYGRAQREKGWFSVEFSSCLIKVGG